MTASERAGGREGFGKRTGRAVTKPLVALQGHNVTPVLASGRSTAPPWRPARGDVHGQLEAGGPVIGVTGDLAETRRLHEQDAVARPANT